MSTSKPKSGSKSKKKQKRTSKKLNAKPQSKLLGGAGFRKKEKDKNKQAKNNNNNCMGCCKQFCFSFLLFLCGIGATIWIIKILMGWTWYHIRMRAFIAIAAYISRNPSTDLCYSQDNQTVISCELAGFTRLVKFRFTKDLTYNTHNKPNTIIPYSRNQLNILWENTFPYPTNLPISITLNDTIHNVESLWIINRQKEQINTPLTDIELQKLKQNLPETGVIVAIHGGALVMGDQSHIIPYLTLLSSFMGKISHSLPILVFNYRLAPECIFPCSLVDIQFIIHNYIHQELGVSMNKIYLVGDSAGGLLSLLFMQKLAVNYHNQINLNVGGAVLISPDCDWTLNNGKGSWDKNKKYDPIILYDTIKLYRSYIFGIYSVDKNNHKIMMNNDTEYDREQCELNENKINFESSKMSPCFGSFQGLPSLYITVSELESLYDDGVKIWKLANDAKNNYIPKTPKRKDKYKNISYILEINKGSSIHELPIMAGVIPEATDTLYNIARFLVDISKEEDKLNNNT